MSKRTFFGKVLKSSLSHRKSRVLVVIIAVVLGVSLASGLIDMSFDIGERTSTTLTGYGANIFLVPKEGTLQVGLGQIGFGSIPNANFIKESDLQQIESAASAKYLVSYTPILYSIANMSGQQLVLAGVWFDAIMKVNPSWQLTGKEIQSRNDNVSAVVGVSAADKLGLKIGDEFELSYGGKVYNFSLVGTLSTGGSEDYQVFVNLDVAQQIDQEYGLVSMVQLNYLVGKEDLATTAKDLATAVPDADVKISSQVVESEESFFNQELAVMIALTVVVLAASTLAVASTVSTSLLERRNEVGLMLALGADSRRITQLFLAEALIIGLLGGFIGYLLGVGLASLIWLQVFNVPIIPAPITIPLTIIIATGVTLIASALPVRQALRINPTVTLKGE